MGESQGGLSAEVDQSAAAGLLWLREGKGDHCGNVAGGPLEGFYTAQLKDINLLLHSLLDRKEFLVMQVLLPTARAVAFTSTQ